MARGTSNYWAYGYDAVGNCLTTQADQAVTTATHNDFNQLVSQAAGGLLRVRGHLNEPGTATVNTEPARVLPGNAFESTTTATTGTSTIAVVGTDLSSNVTSQNYQISVPTGAPTYSYDSNGNLTQKVEGGVTWTYVWNAENRLKWVCNTTPCTQSAAAAAFSYDALGRRVEKVMGAATHAFTYDGEDILRDNRGGGSIWMYVHGPGIDEPLARENQSAAWRYFHADGLGSLVRITNASGTVTDSLGYDAFGQLLAATPSRYAFTGREWDSETGLYYYRARYYDPKVGRFVSEDPIGLVGGINLNLFAYVRNNPVNFVDPMGLQFAPGQGYVTGQGYTTGPLLPPSTSTRPPSQDCSRECNPHGPPYHGAYPPGHVPWNVPYGPSVAASYGNAIGGPIDSNLNDVSRRFPNDPWSNCVRGCLLSAWNQCSEEYIPDFYTAHGLCYTICAGSMIVGGR